MGCRMRITRTACSVRKLMERFFYYQGSDLIQYDNRTACPAWISVTSVSPTFQEADGC